MFEGWQIAEKPDYKLIFGKSPIPIWITTDGRISFSNEPPMSPAEFVRGLYKHDFSLAQRHAGIVQTPEELIALMGDFIVSRGL